MLAQSWSSVVRGRSQRISAAFVSFEQAPSAIATSQCGCPQNWSVGTGQELGASAVPEQAVRTARSSNRALTMPFEDRRGWGGVHLIHGTLRFHLSMSWLTKPAAISNYSRHYPGY